MHVKFIYVVVSAHKLAAISVYLDATMFNKRKQQTLPKVRLI